MLVLMNESLTASSGGSRRAQLHDRSDLGVLKRAADSSRVLVTHSIKTMPAALAIFIESGKSAGVILVPQELHGKLPLMICYQFGMHVRRKSGERRLYAFLTDNFF